MDAENSERRNIEIDKPLRDMCVGLCRGFSDGTEDDYTGNNRH